MGEQGDTPAGERFPQRGVVEKAIEAEVHRVRRLARGPGRLHSQPERVAVMEVGRARRMP